jgi:hypothetical protein
MYMHTKVLEHEQFRNFLFLIYSKVVKQNLLTYAYKQVLEHQHFRIDLKKIYSLDKYENFR